MRVETRQELLHLAYIVDGAAMAQVELQVRVQHGTPAMDSNGKKGELERKLTGRGLL